MNVMIFSHIGENRDEVIAIPVYGWIRNPVETMIRLLMSTGMYSRWCSKYSILKLFPLEDKEHLFSMTMNYTINSFYDEMKTCGKRSGVEEKDVERDFNELIMRADPARSVTTIMDMIIIRLLTEDFVKNIYIYAPVMTKPIKDFLANVFTFKASNIYLIEGNIKDVIERTEPKFTTIFVEDTDMFMDVLQSYDDDALKKYMSETYYVLPAKSSLTNEAKQLVRSKGILPDGEKYKYQKFIEAKLAPVNSYAEFLQLKMLRMEK
jgi:hypothetical protein